MHVNIYLSTNGLVPGRVVTMNLSATQFHGERMHTEEWALERALVFVRKDILNFLGKVAYPRFISFNILLFKKNWGLSRLYFQNKVFQFIRCNWHFKKST